MQTQRSLLRVIAWIVLATFGTTNVLATPIDLATSPLVTGIGQAVAPNLFFILDDSGSMDYEYMPDSANNNRTKNCYRNFGYNSIYFNPSKIYTPPKKADGTSYDPASLAAAWNDGYYATDGKSSATTDLSSTSPIYSTASTAAISLGNGPIGTTNGTRTITVTYTAHGRAVGDTVVFSGLSGTFNGVNLANLNGVSFTIASANANTYTFNYRNAQGGTANRTGSGGGGNSGKATYTYTYQSGTDADFYYYIYTANPTSPPNTCESDGSYTRVPAVGRTWADMSATDQQNFANWYSYYRSRLMMMKSSAGRAFASLGDQYRVGFTTISEQGTGSAKFLDIAKFDDTQKGAWYTKLYSTTTSGSTPLRGALSKAGRYYAGKFADSRGNHDPIQYSCQKNFTILTTDGYWNTGNETSTYTAKKENNTTDIGDQDSGSDVLPPYKDALAKPNTLADIAYYYYNADLRPTSGLGGVTDDGSRIDVSTNDVPADASDPNPKQHMTTFTMGLGVSGVLDYPGDYPAIVAGTKNWPDPQTSPLTTGNGDVTARVDDLWHAGINGHGGYLSAKDPDSVVSELGNVLHSIEAVVGSSSAAATSNLQPVNGDNTAFIAQFKTVDWTGDLVARVIDVVTGQIPNTDTWSAQAKLDAQTMRNIYTFSSTNGAYGHRRDFTAANLAPEIAAGYFNPSALPQWSVLTTTLKGTGPAMLSDDATSQALISYLRGDRTNENAGTWTTPTGVFRQRAHVLGDIVSAAPVFVRKPPFAYTDPGYAAFLASQNGRDANVYVGANDGMLHAFDGSVGNASSGEERWAYIPSMALPNLYHLAASDYSTGHRFYVDGPITVGDAYNSGTSTWATILVGGLGGGGKGYYALDVTDPTSPKVLWEFGTAQDADVGYSYGNPVLTKRASDGRWVVVFASGYNNNGTGSDKKGHLFVVDAFSGSKLEDIATTTTADEQLSGIARISNLVYGGPMADGLKNNTTQYVYAGDLSGALWRFDIDAGAALHMADTSATPGNEPITVQPELTYVNNNVVVYFGTGRYLGPNDLTGPSASVAQGIYAVKDANTNLGVLTSAGANLVAQTLDTSTDPRTTSGGTVDWSLNNGWYITTPVGERFNVDPGLQLGTLVIAANIPETDYCEPSGSSVLYQIDYRSGSVLTTNVFQSQIVGNTQLQLGGSGESGNVHGGKIVIESVLANGTTIETDQKNGSGGVGSVRRVSWRELE